MKNTNKIIEQAPANVHENVRKIAANIKQIIDEANQELAQMNEGLRALKKEIILKLADDYKK
jgi:hypothetical protein